ncbi:hypothetical protein DFH09DRAFT_1338358 [Mycena vulgaris]|nr:hypothetical protein DFH09DRAFT_1338358 [Mycena vulgaris]
MANNPPTTIDAALRRVEHASVVARACADDSECDRTLADLRCAVEGLRAENAGLREELTAVGESKALNRCTVTELEDAPVEERARTVALMEEREPVAQDLTEAAESMKELGQQQRRSLAQLLGGSSTYSTPTPKSCVVVETDSINTSRRKLRPRLATVSVTPTPCVSMLLGVPKSKSPAIASSSDTYPRTRALKPPRLSPATTPEPEQPRSLVYLEKTPPYVPFAQDGPCGRPGASTIVKGAEQLKHFLHRCVSIGIVDIRDVPVRRYVLPLTGHLDGPLPSTHIVPTLLSA